jgi:hypothetical protein
VPERGGGLARQVRPLASVMVPEIMTGNALARSANTSSAGEDRGLRVEGVEDGLDQQRVAPPSIRPRAASA